MKQIIILVFVLAATLIPFEAKCESPVFYETFDSLNLIQENGGIARNGWGTITDGLIDNAMDFESNKAINYPLNNNFNVNNGTIEFMIKMPDENRAGLFDIGNLGSQNSWGIFKNNNYIIMEVKNNTNNFAQAWSPAPVSNDGKWHMVTVVWEKNGDDLSFKLCYDGNCKTDYDGTINNNILNMSDNFCVGWTGWYGYSQSIFDDLKIFNYTKTDTEIMDAYNFYGKPVVALTGNNTIVLEVGETYIDQGATAYDNIDGDISHQIVQTGIVNSAESGEYRISYNVKDTDGNYAKEAIRKVYVVNMSDNSATRAYQHLIKNMDMYHLSFDVYTDFASGGNHGAPSGWMGYTDILEVDPKWDSLCYNGLSCFKNIWETTAQTWVGIKWLQPDGNWGEVSNGGYDLTGASKVTFFARGEVGGEPVTFLAGGVTGDFPDSIQPAASTGVITLTNTWKKYSIDLAGKDLSHVISPFGWTVAIDPIFYLDDIKIDLPGLDEKRFIQSFEIIDKDKEVALANTSYVYDNALCLLAFLARGEADDLKRAKNLADAFVFVLENDRFYHDGRLRNAYMSGDLSEPHSGTAKLPGWWDIKSQSWFEDEFNVSTHTGNIAWAMLALLSYYEKQGGDSYLNAAIKLGEWVENETRDERGSGGYTGGYQGWEQTGTNPPPLKLLYKSTEHNIDLYPAFIRLYNISKDTKWMERAVHAKKFVDSMWNKDSGHFWTGTTVDGVTINKDNIPVDIQAWAVMAMPQESEYFTGLNWAEMNCYLEIDGFKGFDFNDDLDGIWFEGTSQMVVAYQLTDQSDKSETQLVELRNAQLTAPNANGKGIIAASRDNVSTGFNWEYFSRLHLGATAWYIFGEMKYNPYWGRSTLPYKIGLKDVIHVLQTVAGKPAFNNIKDINGDGKIGLEEAVYALQKTAE